MIETGLAIARWLQFAASVLLFGAPAFAVYGLNADARASEQAWLKRLLMGASVVGIIAALMMLCAEAAEMSGEAAQAFDPATIWSVASGTNFGAVWALRLVLLCAMLGLALKFPVRAGIAALSVCGALVAASLAWLGHGGEGGSMLGVLHQGADVLHLLAASFWIGALVVLVHVLRAGDKPSAQYALTRFSGIGALVVATLVLTGIVNTWALTQPRPIGEAITTPYAMVLLIKLGLFAGMLVLAALNRWVLSPRLARASAEDATKALRRSVGAETVLAVLVIAAVAVLGVLEPPNAG